MKAILITDMPKCCDECPAFDYDYYCCFWDTESEVDEKRNEKRQSWCPLKPLPQKEEKPEGSGLDWDTAFNCGYVVGWNACIEEIEDVDK